MFTFSKPFFPKTITSGAYKTSTSNLVQSLCNTGYHFSLYSTFVASLTASKLKTQNMLPELMCCKLPLGKLERRNMLETALVTDFLKYFKKSFLLLQ